MDLQCLAFSLSVMFSRFLCIGAYISTHSFSWLNNIPFMCSPLDECVGCFHLLVIMKSTAMCVRVKIFSGGVIYFSWVCTWEWNCWVLGLLCEWLFEELPDWFAQCGSPVPPHGACEL